MEQRKCNSEPESPRKTFIPLDEKKPEAMQLAGSASKRSFYDYEQCNTSEATQPTIKLIKRNVIYNHGRLTAGILIRRYKRFLADVEICNGDGEGLAEHIVTVYCPNTGPMLGLLDMPMAPVLLSKSEGKKRKYKWTMEMITVKQNGREIWVGIHSLLSNKMVENAIRLRLFPEFAGFTSLRREVLYEKENSRVDFVLSSLGGDGEKCQCFVEVKSVTLMRSIKFKDKHATDCAIFPDTVSVRAQKHVRKLIELSLKSSAGEYDSCRAAIVFLVQRNDVMHFAPSMTHDPVFASLCYKAEKAGVQLIAYSTSIVRNPTNGSYEVVLGKKLQIVHMPKNDEA